METPKHILDILNENNAAQGWPLCTDDDEVLECLRELPQLDRVETGRSRWWTNYGVVVRCGSRCIQFRDAESDDRTASEAGWEFRPDLIREVKEVREMVEVVKYVAIT